MAKKSRGRRRKILGNNLKTLKDLALANPTLAMRELTPLFIEATGVQVSAETVRATLAREGITRGLLNKRARAALEKKTAESQPSSTEEGGSLSSESPTPVSYGYSDEHRSDVGEKRRYPSSLTDTEWELVRDLFEYEGPGQPAQVERRDIVEACSYVVRSGCSWRMLPKEFPKWQNVYAHFRRWNEKGLFEQMHERLRGMWRERVGRNVQPTAAILDSQSVKTGPEGGEKGYDAGKKVKGRKRHLVVDFLGLVLAVLVLPANLQDRAVALEAVQTVQHSHPTIEALIVDSGYSGRCAEQLKKRCGIEVEVIRRPRQERTKVDGQPIGPPINKGFIPLPKRWIVERTNAWNLRFRRLGVDHERLPKVSEAWIWFAQSTMLMRRLATSMDT